MNKIYKKITEDVCKEWLIENAKKLSSKQQLFFVRIFENEHKDWHIDKVIKNMKANQYDNAIRLVSTTINKGI